MDAESDDLFAPQSSDCESEEEIGPFTYSQYLELMKSGHTSQRGYILQTSDVYSSDEDVSPPSPKRSKGARKTSTPKRQKKSKKTTPQAEDTTQNPVGLPPKPSGAPTNTQSENEIAKFVRVSRIMHDQSFTIFYPPHALAYALCLQLSLRITPLHMC